MVSAVGLLFAFAAAGCFLTAAGHTLPWETSSPPTPSSWWPVAGGVALGFSALADILDGRLARRTGLATQFGAVLDSTLDRFGDMAVCIGCALYFAAQGNVTFVLISCVAMAASTQISYVKARAEHLTSGLEVGFWQRAERMVAMILGGLLGRVPTVLCLTALFPLFTVLRRVALARRRLAAAPPSRFEPSFDRLLPWRQQRFSGPYLALCAVIIAAIVVLPRVHPFFYGIADPLRAVLP
jgi:CDP-diacylglycerol--glycerol-3-phosphate 3-phosphatidyltransferase